VGQVQILAQQKLKRLHEHIPAMVCLMAGDWWHVCARRIDSASQSKHLLCVGALPRYL
jgi:hypothetical protein